jgi:hypothetical protein
MSVVQSINKYQESTEALPGNVFNLILDSDVLSHIKHLIMMAHNNNSFSVKAYVGIEGDNRMHWLEETFYNDSDVVLISQSLLNQHEEKNPFCSDDLIDVRNELKSFGLNSNPALSILFPSV